MSETFPALDPVAARVLAVLVEKQQLTPEQYPLTANAVMLACNQKTAREPVMNLSEGEVGHALRHLEDRGLVRVIHGARALRYEHRLGEALGLAVPQRVALALLVLRGPQTMAELATHAERLYRFTSMDELRTALERLASRQPPLVSLLPRAAGQREARWAHRLCGEPLPTPPSPAKEEPAADVGERLARLEARVLALEERLARLLADRGPSSA